MSKSRHILDNHRAFLSKKMLKLFDFIVSVVTGASAGVGRAFTEQLAKNGMNVVIISRTRKVLNDLAEQLSRLTMGVAVETCIYYRVSCLNNNSLEENIYQ